MKTKLLFLLSAAVLLIAASCSKEKQISTNLTSQSGRWNIDNYKIVETTTLGSVTLSPIITDYSDIGYMNFFTNNDGQIFYIYDVGDYDYYEFEWTPTADGIILEYNNTEEQYTFTTNEKDRIVMFRSVVVPNPDTDTIYTTTEYEYELLRIE
jgi:hypothetical protein